MGISFDDVANSYAQQIRLSKIGEERGLANQILNSLNSLQYENNGSLLSLEDKQCVLDKTRDLLAQARSGLVHIQDSDNRRFLELVAYVMNMLRGSR